MRFIVLLLLHFSLFAVSYNFDEHRFVYALDKEFVKSGTISIDEASTTITYEKPDFKKIVSDKEGIRVYSADTEVEVLEGNILVYTKLYLDLIKKIDTVATLKTNRYFDVENDGKIYTLHIKNQLKNYVSKVEVTTLHNSIEKFKIFMLNDDTVEIIKR